MLDGTKPSNAPMREFAPTGTLRAGINLGNPVIAQRDAGGGDPRGVGPALARELARRIGVPVRFVTYETAGKLADAARQDAWDVAFLAIDPDRAADIDFSPAYVHIEGTYMVRDASPLRAVEDVDRAGTRVAVGLKTAYDLFLTRQMCSAELVRSASSPAAIRQFLDDRLDAVAGVRQPLAAAATEHGGLRVMEGNFMVIRQASGVPKGREAAHRYLCDFIAEAKSSGFVARALAESGVAGVSTAP
jgi:polar amino acid transport system substrate-binding protein